jgi:hypothetical protein
MPSEITGQTDAYGNKIYTINSDVSANTSFNISATYKQHVSTITIQVFTSNYSIIIPQPPTLKSIGSKTTLNIYKNGEQLTPSADITYSLANSSSNAYVSLTNNNNV